MYEILLRRKGKVIVTDWNSEEDVKKYVATINKNIESLGYTLSEKLYEALCKVDLTWLISFYKELVPCLKKLVGADVVYNPMYPNFPDSIMNADEIDLYKNAIVHYWSCGTLFPAGARDERFPLFETTTVRVIDIGTHEELMEIFTNLINSKTSLSQQDKDDIVWFFENQANISKYLPNEIPFKENVALIGKLYIEHYPMCSDKDIHKYFKTATDVLRLVTAMSDGDISLATNTKYRSLRRKERRIIMGLLQECGNIEEDMKRYAHKWIRIGEVLHPGEYNPERYKKVITAFSKIRNGDHIDTWKGKAASGYEKGDYTSVVKLLAQRPGEMARDLDHILRLIDNKNIVVNTFKSVADKVSTNVLLQVREHFLHRDMEKRPESRVFFPKGNLARAKCIANNLSDIPEKYCAAIVRICENALVEQYKDRDFLGSVYLSEEYKNYVVPFSQRSASKAIKTIVRGSRLPISDDIKTLRGFIWWTNRGGDDFYDMVDIDLSAAIFDENWNYIEHVSYTNLRSEKYRATHSGDITNGGSPNGDGVSEFLDTDIDSVVKFGARYIVYQVYNYSDHKFSDLPHAMFGWMGRQDVSSGEIYEPKTVEQKMDLTAQSTVCIPVIFDCVAREMIWCDMSISLDFCGHGRGGNNVESNLVGVAATCYGIVNMKKPNLYDLIKLHIRARGLETDNKEDADVVFDIADGITPFDIDIFMGQYI